MNLNEKEKKEVRELVKLYFECNPQYNKGIAFKAKANDIISSYYKTHQMPYKEIENCIKSNPMCKMPIWDQFYQYWFKEYRVNTKKNKSNNNIEEKKSGYKDTVSDSTNPFDYL